MCWRRSFNEPNASWLRARPWWMHGPSVALLQELDELDERFSIHAGSGSFSGLDAWPYCSGRAKNACTPPQSLEPFSKKLMCCSEVARFQRKISVSFCKVCEHFSRVTRNIKPAVIRERWLAVEDVWHLIALAQQWSMSAGGNGGHFRYSPMT